MELLLEARRLQHQAGASVLFDELSLVINTGDRLGLVGHNGSGKSTLLRLLSLQQAPDAGEISVRRGLRIAQVAQFLPAEQQQLGVREALLRAMPQPEGWRAEALLAEFAFSTQQYAQPLASLSGGQQNRLMFAQALAQEPELLLLDEPTNHLDLATMVLFEQRLQAFAGACVLVSHDRTFLDATTQSTLFLRDQGLRQFSGAFSQARLMLEADDAARAERAKAEQKQIDGLRASAKRLANWGRVYNNEDLARRARSMNKRVDKLETARTEVSTGSPLSLSLSLGGSRAKQALAIDSLAVRIPQRVLFRIQDLVLRPGERVALLGHNGCGKSTFIRQLVAAAATPDTHIRLNPQVRLGYYDQELDEVSGSQGLIEFVRARTSLAEQAARQQLIAAGFPYLDHDKRIDMLSGGERARLLFLTLAAVAPNFLILDEPTNHIDIDGKEQLEAQLLASDATVLITSHDRRFIETVASRYWLIEAGQLREVTHPERFFNSRSEELGDAVAVADSPAPSTEVPVALSDEQLLEAIESLEALLSADRQRKPKFQKPARQAQWEAQLASLYARLEAE